MCFLTRARTKSSLSVCMITQDCAERMSCALSSIAGVADEIILVDGGSSDSTPEVARSFPQVRYMQRDWPGDIGEQKNFAIRQATCDWVFVLDSDEMMGERFRTGVHRWINSSRYTHYKFPRYWLTSLNPMQHAVTDKLYPDLQLRLFRNSPFWQYQSESTPDGTPTGRVHHRFPRDGRGRGKKLRGVHTFHFDFLYNSRAMREAKVALYDEMDPATKWLNHLQYLYEDHPHVIRNTKEPLGIEVEL